jgi:hypothetical protein
MKLTVARQLYEQHHFVFRENATQTGRQTDGQTVGSGLHIGWSFLLRHEHRALTAASAQNHTKRKQNILMPHLAVLGTTDRILF